MVDIVLETLPLYRITVDRKDLVKKVKELWSDETLVILSERTNIPLVALREMTWMAFLKRDVAGGDVQGYRKYRGVLKAEGFDV